MLVYLADDHHLVAKGIASLLEQIETIENVHVFQHGKELIQELNNKRPDFIFLDVEMSVMDGRETLKAFQKIIPATPCCMLSMVNDKAVIEDCINAGARGFIHKNCTIDELKEAIVTIKNSEVYHSKEVLKYLSGIKQTSTSHILKEPISEREMEILILLCDGFSPREIGEKLFLSHRTVETHKNNIMQKFDVNSVTKLVSVALKSKIV